MMIPYNLIYNFILTRCINYDIDESHAIKHSMDVLRYSQKILLSESIKNPFLLDQEKIIYTSAMLHDMCDKKYMSEDKGLKDLTNFMEYKLNYNLNEIKPIIDIIGTMSYSTVKKQGYPDLKEYQLAYHIVREADLLTAYDVERCMVYGIIGKNMDYYESFKATRDLYNVRMGKHINDKLFTTNFALNEAKKLDKENKERLNELEKILQI